MLEMLQKSFAPFSLRSVRTVRPGAQEEWSATICVNGAAVGKLHTLPEPAEGRKDINGAPADDQEVVQYAMDLCFNHDCHRTHFEQHTSELIAAGVLDAQDHQAAMVDLLTLMADAYLGDKTMFRLAKEGSTIFRLRSDPLNAYRRLHRTYTPYLGQELKLLYQDLEWVLNEEMASSMSSPTTLRLVTSGNAATVH